MAEELAGERPAVLLLTHRFKLLFFTL